MSFCRDVCSSEKCNQEERGKREIYQYQLVHTVPFEPGTTVIDEKYQVIERKQEIQSNFNLSTDHQPVLNHTSVA
jgi:hypothetical protein